MTKEERKIYRRKYWLDNKDKELKRSREWKKNNSEKMSEYNKNWKEKNKIKCSYHSYKIGALKRNLEFKLKLDYFIDNKDKNCYYCGSKIKGIGIDRIDNNIGYVKENCVNCCKICNRMKSNYNVKYFLEHCKKIYLKTNNSSDKK